MKHLSILAAALLTMAGAASAKPAHFNLDPNHTQVAISWTHFGFSHPAARFDSVTGDFNFDVVDPTHSSIVVTIPIASLDTGVPALDKHLKSPDFFDAGRFPTATFKSTSVQRVGEHGLKVSGDLTIHGVTKPAVLDVTVNKIGDHPMGGVAAGFDAKTVVRRSDFGITKYVPNVSDDIAITITTEAKLDQPAPADQKPADKK
ncbi:MAG: yceI-like domain protein [Xanthomonadaceae bacterium]|nr:yceI-like domain protein [Xanthomonadaceae bacterium]